VLFRSPGNLTFLKQIIAAVPPVFYLNSTPADAVAGLVKTFSNTFEAASANGLERLSLTPMGNALFKNPMPCVMAALHDALITVICNSEASQTTLKVIRITDKDPAVIRDLRVMLDGLIQSLPTNYVDGRQKWRMDSIDAITADSAPVDPAFQWYWSCTDVEKTMNKFSPIVTIDGQAWVPYDADSNWLVDLALAQQKAEVELVISQSESSNGRNYKLLIDSQQASPAGKQVNTNTLFSREVRTMPFATAVRGDTPTAITGTTGTTATTPPSEVACDDDDVDDDVDDVGIETADGGDSGSSLQMVVQSLGSVTDATIDRIKTSIARCIITKECRWNAVLSPVTWEDIKIFCNASKVDIVRSEVGSQKYCFTLKGAEEVATHAKEFIQDKQAEIASESEALSLPATWVRLPAGSHTAPVSRDSPEFQEVLGRFVPSLGDQADIVSVERIQNERLYTTFENSRRADQKYSGSEPQRELLWHGTCSKSPDIIYASKDGFAVNVAREACLWGTGIYFAVNASYSDNGYYFNDVANGVRRMMLCDVIVGDYYDYNTKTDSSLRLPPLKPGSLDNFDSVSGITGSPSSRVFIVYRDHRAYPKYVISYKKK